MSDMIPPLAGPGGDREKFFLWRLEENREVQYFPVWMWVDVEMGRPAHHTWLKYDEVSYERYKNQIPPGTYYCLTAPPRGLDPSKLHWEGKPV